MVEIGSRSYMDENFQKVTTVSATVKCPVCDDVIQITKAENYYLLSNFHKHIKSHLKQNNKGGKRKLGSKGRKVDAKRKSRQLNKKEVGESNANTSSESDDSAAVLKEMEKNLSVRDSDEISEESNDEAGTI